VAKKPKTMRDILDRFENAKAMAATVELALGAIKDGLLPEDTRDIRTVAYLTVKRLRKIEKWLYAHAKAELEPVLPEVPHG
jgi:hypothetical protein